MLGGKALHQRRGAQALARCSDQWLAWHNDWCGLGAAIGRSSNLFWGGYRSLRCWLGLRRRSRLLWCGCSGFGTLFTNGGDG
jgi:hypothetical protein